MRFLDNEKRIISFVGFSGSGKTTFIEQLIKEIKRRGFSVAVIKHDAHRFQMDKEGKDTYRFYEAGSDCVAISSEEKLAVIKSCESCPDVHEMIDLRRSVSAGRKPERDFHCHCQIYAL